MSWTTPVVPVSGTLITAAWATTSVTDNLLALFNTSAQLRGQMALLSTISPSALGAGSTHNWNPTGLSTANCVRITHNEGGGVTLTGIAAQPDGTLLLLVNIGAGVVTLPHQDGGSSSVNRFRVPGGTATTLQANGIMFIRYDGNVTHWHTSDV